MIRKDKNRRKKVIMVKMMIKIMIIVIIVMMMAVVMVMIVIVFQSVNPLFGYFDRYFVKYLVFRGSQIILIILDLICIKWNK
jgi:hypothetical protein